MDKLQEIKKFVETQNLKDFQSFFLYGNAEITEINKLQESFDLLLYLIEVEAPLPFIAFTAKLYSNVNYATRYREVDDVIPLFYAMEQEAFPVAEFLLQMGAKINYRIPQNQQQQKTLSSSYNVLTYLYHQKKSLSRRQLFFLLQHGIDINEGQDLNNGQKEGQNQSQSQNYSQGNDVSFLYYVVDHQDLSLLHTLLRYILFGQNDHRTILHLLQACTHQKRLSDEQLYTLLESEKKKIKWSPAMYISAVRHKNLLLLQTLYQYDYEVSSFFLQTKNRNNKNSATTTTTTVTTTTIGTTTTMTTTDIDNKKNNKICLFEQLLSLACSSPGQLPIIRFLIEEVGVDVNVNTTTNPSKTLPIIVAARYGFQDYARILLEHGADVNAKNRMGFTALMMASQYGKKAMVQLLVENGADIHAQNYNRHTALMYACEEEHVEICHYLIEKGADVNEKDNKDSTILMNAVRNGNKDLVNLLFQQPNLKYNEKNYNGWNALMYGCFGGSSIDILQGLIDRGEALNDQDVNGFTSLMMACLNGKKKVVEYLIGQAVDINVKNKSGTTALMVVSQNGHRDIVKLLLDHGARIEACDHLGNTALMYATLNKQKWIADDLVQEGANINARNQQGDFPLLMACRNGSRELIELFLRNGAEVNASNHKNLTPLQVTQMRGFQDLSRVLIACGARPPENEIYRN